MTLYELCIVYKEEWGYSYDPWAIFSTFDKAYDEMRRLAEGLSLHHSVGGKWGYVIAPAVVDSVKLVPYEDMKFYNLMGMLSLPPHIAYE